MKKTKKILATVLALICVCSSGSGALSLVNVSAGVSDINIVNSSSFKYSVSTADWLVTGVKVSNRSLYFSPEGTEDDRIISKKKIENLKDLGYTECFTSELTITPVALADTFYVMFGIDGLSGLKTAAETENTSAIALTAQENDVYISVLNFDEEAEKQFVLEPTKLEDVALSDSFDLSMTVDVDGGIVLDINGENLLTALDANVDTNGYIGFAQMGLNEVFVNKVDVNAYTNATPENFNYVERFDKNEMNHNAWYTKSAIGYYTNSYLRSENGTLHFSNVGNAQASSTYQFSNFVLDFDLADMQRVAEYDENGKVVRPVNKQFGVEIGATVYKTYDTPMYTFKIYGDDATALRGATSTMLTIENYGKTVALISFPEEYNIWDENIVAGRAVCFRIKVVDKVAVVMVKYADEAGYTTVCTYALDATPTGYVKIRGYGDTYSAASLKGMKYREQGNFKIDNLMIKNLDVNGKVKDIGYKFYKWEIPEDFDYVDPWL